MESWNSGGAAPMPTLPELGEDLRDGLLDVTLLCSRDVRDTALPCLRVETDVDTALIHRAASSYAASHFFTLPFFADRAPSVQPCES